MARLKDVTLTRDDERAVEWIARFWASHGYGPTLAELAHAFGYSSKSNAAYRVTRLVRLGLARVDAGKRRTLRLREGGRT